MIRVNNIPQKLRGTIKSFLKKYFFLKIEDPAYGKTLKILYLFVKLKIIWLENVIKINK